MIQLILVIGFLALVTFLLSRQETFLAVTTGIGKDDFCPDNHLPVSLGIAPEWRNSDISQIKFFIDTTTGCIFQGSPLRLRVPPPIVMLNDRAQIARFIQLNGLPPTSVSDRELFQTPTLVR